MHTNALHVAALQYREQEVWLCYRVAAGVASGHSCLENIIKVKN